jgi:hypothetical protein
VKYNGLFGLFARWIYIKLTQTNMLMTQVDRTLEIEKKFLGIALTVH